MNEVKLAAAQGSTPFRWRGMVWITCKARKPSRCWHTGQLIPTGAFQFRPLSNGQHRMERLSEMPATAEPFPGASNTQPSRAPASASAPGSVPPTQ